MAGLEMSVNEYQKIVGNDIINYPFFISYFNNCKITPKSMKIYFNRFIQFIHYIQQNYKIEISSFQDFLQINQDMLSNFIHHDASQSIKKSKYYALNSLYEYLKNEDYIQSNIVKNIEIPKVKNEIKINYLTENEINKIIRYLEKEIKYSASSRKDMLTRDLAMFSLAINTGLKPSMLVQIKQSDIQDKFLIVDNTKIKLDIKTLRRIKDCKQENEEYLFVNNRKKTVSIRQFEKTLDAYEDIIHRKVNPQLLRATYAHRALEKNVSPLDIAKRMGISPVTLVSRYLQNE